MTHQMTSDKNKMIDRDISVDQEISAVFHKEFSVKKEEKEKISKKSPLIQKMEQRKANRFGEEFEKLAERQRQKDADVAAQKMKPVQERKSLRRSSGGQSFTLQNKKQVKTLIYKIRKGVDYPTLTRRYMAEKLDSEEVRLADGTTEQTFFIDEVESKGHPLIVIHINQDVPEVYVNMGFLDPENGSVKFGKNPMYMPISMRFPTENCELDEEKYDLEHLSEEEKQAIRKKPEAQWWRAELNASQIIIDPEKGEAVLREVYFDEEKGAWAARIKITPGKSYFAFNVCPDGDQEGAGAIPLSVLEIGTFYRQGLYKFPQDLLKAAEYLEQDTSAEGYYQMAQLFLQPSEFFDEELGQSYLRQAAEAGHGQAIMELSLTGDEEERKHWGRRLLEVSEQPAQFVSACLYETGEVLGGKDLEQAFQKYLDCAEAGYLPACYRLGMEPEEKPDENIKEAFQKSAQLEDGTVLYLLGSLFFRGYQVSENKALGFRFLEEAAELGFTEAAYEVAEILDEGDGIRQDKAAALRWYEQLAEIDSELLLKTANRYLDGIGCEVGAASYEKAKNLLNRAADRGNSSAYNNLAWMHEHGYGFVQDYEQAKILYEQSAALGNASACWHLGELYEQGLGVPKDSSKALEYYEEAAELGSSRAKEKLESYKTKAENKLPAQICEKIQKAYTGNDRYAFVSYRHTDAEKVFPIIAKLQSEQQNIWYDEGIDPGTEWDEEIARYLKGADTVLAFVTNDYIASDNCIDELKYARTNRIRRILIYLEKVELPDGLQMRVGTQQAVYYYKYQDKEEFYEKILRVLS